MGGMHHPSPLGVISEVACHTLRFMKAQDMYVSGGSRSNIWDDRNCTYTRPGEWVSVLKRPISEVLGKGTLCKHLHLHLHLHLPVDTWRMDLPFAKINNRWVRQ